MKILEQYIQSKTGDIEMCEDGIFISDDFVCIVDGATSKTKTLWNGKATGKIAKDLVLEAVAGLASDVSAMEGIRMLNDAFIKWYEEKGILDKVQVNPEERPSAAAIIFNKYHSQLWIVADCQALVDGKYYSSPLRVDEMYGTIRSYVIELELLKGKTVDELREKDTGREFITPLLAEQQHFLNSECGSEFSYGALDGFFNNKFLKVVNVPKETRYVVLASDGYPELYQSLKESEDALAQILKEDPLLFRRFKASKGLVKGNISFDDRAYVKIEL